ncbi:type III-A CRISPR-associated RAMP protein Csm3 [Candidatus Symbiobacter mobilis]|uniref:CRISPR system Cms endoribonuclease Csm3 n=1 Tax=Candidatus Symbiobacter mobilis CR TaxID=946483 RepID=U5N9J9_9BURK|nr:type III-A CRISPR-associated RAMP protein Csm3 [Candidatus Symbiobacter mobilis]AGX86913.1 hypothetical protein Cenrod_0807 [Candidatus Symbiobacter mobilis CR]
MSQLHTITTITATLEVLSGLRIGAGDGEMHIGGVDNKVIKHPYTQEPYLPGSSLKGKVRSLLEWRSGAVQNEPLGWKNYCNADASTPIKQEVLRILQLFGTSGGDKLEAAEAALVGPSRLSFWDCPLRPEWVQRVREDNLPLTEVKSENRIHRISGMAKDPRQTERVPAGAQFDFRLSIKKLEGDQDQLLDTVLQGLKLLELDSLGGSGSRGYGKVRFVNLCIDGACAKERFAQVKPFGDR